MTYRALSILANRIPQVLSWVIEPNDFVSKDTITVWMQQRYTRLLFINQRLLKR